MKGLTKTVARHIIDKVQRGIPPEHGFQFFTEGLDPYVTVLDEEYFSTFLKSGGSSFKLVVGTYGGGKTHFLYCVRELAWKHNFSVSYVALSPEESPFHRLDLVYATIVKGIMPPLTPDELMSGYEKGIDSFIRSWVSLKRQEFMKRDLKDAELRKALLESVEELAGIESTSFFNAIRSAFRAVVERRDEDFRSICQWLKGEGFIRGTHSKFGILQKIDRTTAFSMIRSLVQWVRQIGYSGLAILLDEAAQESSLSTKQREIHLNNLREVIDACGQSNIQGAIIFYAVPDLNFLDGKTRTYTALNQRLSNTFDQINRTGVQIELDKLLGETEENAVPFLKEVGSKLATVYETANNHTFDEDDLQATIERTAKGAFQLRYADASHRREFVEKVVKGLSHLHNTGDSSHIGIFGTPGSKV